MQLVEDAVDGCWIGYKARSAITGDSGIGSVYSPPKDDNGSPVATTRKRRVETVVDIGCRPQVITTDAQNFHFSNSLSLRAGHLGVKRAEFVVF